MPATMCSVAVEQGLSWQSCSLQRHQASHRAKKGNRGKPVETLCCSAAPSTTGRGFGATSHRKSTWSHALQCTKRLTRHRSTALQALPAWSETAQLAEGLYGVGQQADLLVQQQLAGSSRRNAHQLQTSVFSLGSFMGLGRNVELQLQALVPRLLLWCWWLVC